MTYLEYPPSNHLTPGRGDTLENILGVIMKISGVVETWRPEFVQVWLSELWTGNYEEEIVT
jgi:hypothetical protein